MEGLAESTQETQLRRRQLQVLSTAPQCSQVPTKLGSLSAKTIAESAGRSFEQSRDPCELLLFRQHDLADRDQQWSQVRGRRLAISSRTAKTIWSMKGCSWPSRRPWRMPRRRILRRTYPRPSFAGSTAVGDEEGGGAGVVGDDAQRRRLNQTFHDRGSLRQRPHRSAHAGRSGSSAPPVAIASAADVEFRLTWPRREAML